MKNFKYTAENLSISEQIIDKLSHINSMDKLFALEKLIISRQLNNTELNRDFFYHTVKQATKRRMRQLYLEKQR